VEGQGETVEERGDAGTAVRELRVSGTREEDDGHSKNEGGRRRRPGKKRQRDGAQVRNSARAKRACHMS
jgi:hypothetical protein